MSRLMSALLALLLILYVIPLISSVSFAVGDVEPYIWHDYEYFDEVLDPGYCFELSRTCYAVQVCITSITGEGDKVSVTITVGGVLRWGGILKAGERSPVIQCNDRFTEVHIANPYPNGSKIWIRVNGYVDWVMH